jgi:nitrite reductase/ring-hydroxylating ferredoxin subunit
VSGYVDRWWAVAHEQAVPADRPIARRIGDQPIVLFRDGAGMVRALEDRCAHRRAPLSLGHRTEDGLIQCPYHGWRYDGAAGKCRAIPNFSADEKVPGNFAVAAFATRIAGGIVFVWNGPPAGAETAPFPAPALATNQSVERGEGALPCPHAMFAALILDRPSAVIDIGGVRILDDFRWGDPRASAGQVRSDFGAVPAGRLPDRLPSTPSMTLEIAVAAGTAAADITLRDEGGAAIAGAYVAAVAEGELITRLLYAGWTSGRHGFGLRTALDVDNVARTRRAALPEWQAI